MREALIVILWAWGGYVTCQCAGDVQSTAGYQPAPGCVDCYPKVVSLIKESVYEGASGTYVFRPDNLTVIPGEYLFPIAYYQIQNQKHVGVDPPRFKTGDYMKPPWIK